MMTATRAREIPRRLVTDKSHEQSGISTNPQHSKQQQDINLIINNSLMTDAHGNVEKSRSGWFKRRPCDMQVYSEKEVAENMVKQFDALKISSRTVRCPICNLLHVLVFR